MSYPTLPFLDVFRDASSGNTKTPQKEFLGEGDIPVVDQGQKLIAGYVNDRSRVCKETPPVIVFGDHTKAIKYVDFKFAMGADGTKVLVPKIEGDSKYLYYALRTINIPDAGYSRHYKFLKEAEIPLPPLAEQKRIAGILDAADALRAKRRKSLAQLDIFLQSTFLDLFGDPVTNPKGWEIVKFSDVVERLEGGKNVAQSETPTDFRVLKVSAVTSGEYRPEESKFLPQDFEVPELHVVKKGDLLISRANTVELIGATAYVWETPGNIALPDKIWRLVWESGAKVEPLFVYHLSHDAEFRRILGSRASGTSGSMKNISKSKLLGLPIPLPPLSLQRQFATIVELVERQKERMRAHLAELDALFASLQSRAFNGEL